MPKTLADSTALIARHLANEGAEVRRTATVIAPCCGRRCTADMVADLRGVPGTATNPGGRGRRRDLEWACDGCRERIAREDGWTRSRLMRARGYPWPSIKLERAKELARQDIPDRGRYNLGELRQSHLDRLPDRDIPGTEPPEP